MSALHVLAASALLWLTGCGSLLAPGHAHVWYQLEARSAPPSAASGDFAVAPQPPASDRAGARPPPNQTPAGPRPRLMLSALEAGALYENTSIVFGHSTGTRAYYQYASWAERPSRRIIRLLDERLNTRLRAQAPDSRRFAWVALDTSGLVGDWVLGIRIRDFYHDLGTPNQAVGELEAELLDWQAKSLIARRVFRAKRAVAVSNVTGAVAGLSAATDDLLDQIAEWLDSLAPDRGTAASEAPAWGAAPAPPD